MTDDWPQALPMLHDGVPYCQSDCPAHDGKRCRLTGFRADVLCEPAVRDLVAENARLRAVVESLGDRCLGLVELVQRRAMKGEAA